MEVWRPIPSVPGYEASSAGRIRNAATGHVLSLFNHSRGYQHVHLGRRHRNKLVHRLVCEAWHGAPPGGEHADHIDFDRRNNEWTNLRWLDAGLNRGRHVYYGPDGWTTDADAPVPDDYVPSTEAEREAIERELQAAGW